MADRASVHPTALAPRMWSASSSCTRPRTAGERRRRTAGGRRRLCGGTGSSFRVRFRTGVASVDRALRSRGDARRPLCARGLRDGDPRHSLQAVCAPRSRLRSVSCVVRLPRRSRCGRRSGEGLRRLRVRKARAGAPPPARAGGRPRDPWDTLGGPFRRADARHARVCSAGADSHGRDQGHDQSGRDPRAASSASVEASRATPRSRPEPHVAGTRWASCSSRRCGLLERSAKADHRRGDDQDRDRSRWHGEGRIGDWVGARGDPNLRRRAREAHAVRRRARRAAASARPDVRGLVVAAHFFGGIGTSRCPRPASRRPRTPLRQVDAHDASLGMDWRSDVADE